MSEYDDLDGEDQSEDGEIMKSPGRNSPLPLSKDNNSFSMSEDDADDTADSLDIKPPQAMVMHHHKVSARSSSSKRDKHSERDRRQHVHGSKMEMPHRKGHHRSREHREHREERIREKHRHRERREAAGVGKRERDLRPGKEKPPERLLEDLRERLLDKRRDGERRLKLERRDRRAVEEENPREKAERIEKEMRRERLLEAEFSENLVDSWAEPVRDPNREMVRQKEVYRRELEARRERRHMEKEKERSLREMVKKRDRSRSREDKCRREDGGEEAKEKQDSDKEVLTDMIGVVEVSDDSEVGPMDPQVDDGVEEVSPAEDEASSEDTSSDSEEAGDTEDSAGHLTDEEGDYKGGVQQPSPSPTSPTQAGQSVGDSEMPQADENGLVFAPDSPKSDIVMKEDPLPPYLPAIQGCRSVEEFQCLNRIEEGTYGVVYRARDKRTEEVVALKRLKMEKEKEGFPITSLREINTLLKAQHPNIVTVREIVVGSNMDKIFIVMDYVEHDLKSLMETMKQKKQVFIPGEVKCLMQQLLRAVSHLHDNWILHRDLKTSNLLLSHKGILKVGDFGLAREYGSPLKAYTPVVVTLWYRSPELLLCTKEYSTPVDMWSVGCIFGEFISMEALFPGKSEVDQLNRIFKDLGTPNEKIWTGYSKLPAVQKMTFTEYPVSQLRNRFGAMLTEGGMGLINRFLTYDPVQRVTAEDALRHDYFKEAPLAIDPAMFPTWPAKSELAHRKVAASPKPPPGGAQYKQLGDTDDDVAAGGFHMGLLEKGRSAVGAGFSLKF